MPKYFEDLNLGDTLESPRSIEVTYDDIVSFAGEWDPQLFHIDDDAGKRSPVGQLFASAFHTMCLGHKLAHEAGAFEFLPAVGLGVSDINVPRPVLPGDSLRTRVTVQEKRASGSKPDQGIVKLLMEVFNQNDELALSYVITELVYRRPA